MIAVAAVTVPDFLVCAMFVSPMRIDHSVWFIVLTLNLQMKKQMVKLLSKVSQTIKKDPRKSKLIKYFCF